MRLSGIQAITLALLTIVFSFAGCAGKPTGVEPSPSVSVTTSDDTGAILGTVIDDSGLPLPNVHVGIRELPDAPAQATTALGQFGFSDLEPSEYTLDLQHIGFDAIYGHKVTVIAGEVAEPEIQMTPAAVAGPYADPMQQTGAVYISAGWTAGNCAVNAEVDWIICNAFALNDDTHASQHKFEVEDPEDTPLQTLIAEVVWEAQSGACPAHFKFDLVAPGFYDFETDEAPPADAPTFLAESFESPIYLRIDRAQMDAQNVTTEDGSGADGEWISRIFARSGGRTSNTMADANCAVEQPFTVYLAAFYGDPAPDGWSQAANM